MRLFLPTLTLASAAGVQAWDSTVHATVAPTAYPTITEEPWRCVTENATHFFKVPQPTGALFSALDSPRPPRLLPPKEAWRGFTTAAPTAVLSAWTSLGSAASSFWAAKSSAAVALARQCPRRWCDTSLGVLGGSALLNQTIILSACYQEVLDQGSGEGGGTTAAASTAPVALPTVTPAPAAPTPVQEGIPKDCDRWHLVKSGDYCQKIVDTYQSFPLSQFYSWNPAVKSDCSGLWLEYYVCINVKAAPTQPKVNPKCNKWHFVSSGDYCQKIADLYIISLAKFYEWNPDVGSNCALLFLDYYVCVGA